MGRRYYCDFCEKSFIDDLDARKRHLNGITHQTAKTEHYAAYRDFKTIYEEESQKTECMKFMKTGYCMYGNRCRFTHFTKQQLCEIQQHICNEEYEKERRKHEEYQSLPSVSSWLEKNNAEKFIKKSTGESVIPWTYPEYLHQRNDLPPSLFDLRTQEFTDSNFESWG